MTPKKEELNVRPYTIIDETNYVREEAGTVNDELFHVTWVGKIWSPEPISNLGVLTDNGIKVWVRGKLVANNPTMVETRIIKPIPVEIPAEKYVFVRVEWVNTMIYPKIQFINMDTGRILDESWVFGKFL